MTALFFLIGVMLGTLLGLLIACLVIIGKQADKKKPGKVVGTVSPDLLDEWQACYNVEESLWDSTCEELGLDPDGGYEIDIETGVVMQNDPSG